MQKQCSPPTMFQREILPLLSHKNPWGRMEMCLRHITVGCSYSTQSEMTLIRPHACVFTQASQTQSLHWVYSHHAWLCNILHSHTKQRPQDLHLLKNMDWGLDRPEWKHLDFFSSKKWLYGCKSETSIK